MASTSVRETAPSLRSSIAETVRADILSGRLVPGTRISTADLQTRFDVSLGAVREALLQLAADNLAIAVDRRGFHVAPVSVPDLQDLARSRAEIETFAIRDAIANSTSATEGDILAALHRLDGIVRNDDGTLSPEWYEEHRRYHATLVAACSSRWMSRFRATLHDQFERYCRISMALRHSTKAKDRHSHRALAEAMLARDADLACEIMNEHIWGTVQIVLSTATIAPD